MQPQLRRKVRPDMNNDAPAGDLPAIEEVLDDRAASFWLKAALRSALSRDPVDAANDADAAASWITTHRFKFTWSSVDEVHCLAALLNLAARMSWDCSASGWS